MMHKTTTIAMFSFGVLVFGASLSGGCQRPVDVDPSAPQGLGIAPSTASASGQRPSIPIIAGSTCHGREDCQGDLVCVAGVCHYPQTSASGEVLVAAAVGQLETGDLNGAVTTFDLAIEAFKGMNAPVPPGVLCEAALVSLRAATDAETREKAARRADACFRGSLPEDPVREDVATAIARLRYEGIDMALFDRATPPERFFTREPSRPTADAIEIAIDLPDHDGAGYAAVGAVLEGDGARHAIADCFVQDWELRHQRSAAAPLIISFATRMQDMGDYDVFRPEVEIRATTLTEDGFEPCVSAALTAVVRAELRSARGGAAWQAPFDVRAQLQ